jgi:hypothetical protein
MSAPSFAAGPDPLHDLRELSRQVQDLQRRVLALEERLGDSTTDSTAPDAAVIAPFPVPGTPARLNLTPNALPMLGRVLVALAGAYVLRALTDFGALPRATGLAIGLIYAVVWLFIGARQPVEREFSTFLMCSTSMLIMAPLIWEASERLKAMSSWVSSAILVGFTLIGLALSWWKRQIIISGVVCVSSTLIAAALLLATRDLLPFTLALIAIAAATEFAACRDRQTGSRWLSAIAADAAVLVFSWLMSRENGLPDGYVPTSARAVLAAQLLLIVIYISTAVTQAVARRRTLTFFEMVQTASALLIGMGGVVWVFNSNGAAMLALGISGLIGGLACYVISFLLFDLGNKWNFRAWSTFGLCLVLAGTFLPFSTSGFWVLWCGCAVACCWAAMAARRPTLGLHGVVYLVLGAAVSGATSQSLWALFGSESVPFQWLVSCGVLAAAMLSWVAITMSWPGETAHWRKQVSSLAVAAIIVWILSGIAVRTLILVWEAVAKGQNGRIPADTLGTVVLITFSVALAWASSHWPKRELVWLVYGFMGLGAWKLLTRDFINERNLTLVISLLFYGGALIFLPRMLPRKRADETAEQ